MATRSTIALKLKSGKVVAVYCHWSGAIEDNGLNLVRNYNNYKAAESIIEAGSFSELRNTIAESITHEKMGNAPIRYTYENLADYLENHDGEEYDYIFTGRTWKVVRNGKLHSLNRMVSKL
jgi:hypothetical protein